MLFASPLKSDPPERRFHNGNSFLLHTISKYVLIDYSKGLLDDVNQLSEDNKNALIEINENATVAILLYEFASGFGPSTRYFYDHHPFTKELKTGSGIRWIMEQYIKGNQQDIFNIRYQFSPLYYPLDAKIWSFAIKQHVTTLSTRNLSQFVLGSFNADVTRLGDIIVVHLWNNTSKRSLFWGLGKRNQRPLPLGSIKQHVYITFTLEELESFM